MARRAEKSDQREEPAYGNLKFNTGFETEKDRKIWSTRTIFAKYKFPYREEVRVGLLLPYTKLDKNRPIS